MNILITLENKEILKKIEIEDIKGFITENLSKEELLSLVEVPTKNSNELWKEFKEQLEEENCELDSFIVEEISSETLLRAMDDTDIVDYVENYTEYYIADDIPELMEQIHRSGSMDEVIEMFTIKY